MTLSKSSEVKMALTLLLAVLFGWRCGPSEGEGLDPQQGPLIMKVGERKIFQENFTFYTKLNYPELQSQDQDGLDDELWSFIFDKYCRDVLIGEISNALGFPISDDEIETFIAANMTGFPLEELDDRERALWRTEIRSRLAIKEFLEREILDDIRVSEEEVSTYFENNQEALANQPNLHIRFLKIDNEEKAGAFLAEMKKGRTKLFKDVAPDFAANEGYTIAVPMKRENLIEPFRKALARMKPGQHSKAIPVNEGGTTYYYILYLESIDPEVEIPFEEAFHQIRRKLEQEKSRELLNQKIQQFEKHIKVEIFPEHLPFNYVEPSKREEV